jgi:Methylase involved in ubiquinone/menaquinone biosynthesis
LVHPALRAVPANDPAEAILSDDQSAFVGSIPEHYDRNLGPIIFTDYAADIARRAAAGKPAKVLETAAGTGIVTRALRDHLPAGTRLTATDLNEPMLDVARTKFRAGEQVEFQPADAMALPFADGSFDTVVCQFGVMFFPDKDQSYREVYRVLTPGGRYLFNIWDSHRYNAAGRIVHEIASSHFPTDPPQFMSVPFSYLFEPAKESLLAAGFTDITAAVVRLEKDLPKPEMLARGLVLATRCRTRSDRAAASTPKRSSRRSLRSIAVSSPVAGCRCRRPSFRRPSRAADPASRLKYRAIRDSRKANPIADQMPSLGDDGCACNGGGAPFAVARASPAIGRHQFRHLAPRHQGAGNKNTNRGRAFVRCQIQRGRDEQ